MAPTAQMSERPSTSAESPSASSCAMKPGVPKITPAAVAGVRVQSGDPEIEHLERVRARPEEVPRLQVAVDDPVRVRNLEGRESLPGDPEHLAKRQLVPRARRADIDRLPDQELHHQIGGAIVVDVVVENADCPGACLVRDVRLAEEAGARLGAAGELRVQHLDGCERAVPVRRRVDRRHPTDADEPVELPLPAEGVAYAGVVARRVVRIRHAFPWCVDQKSSA